MMREGGSFSANSAETRTVTYPLSLVEVGRTVFKRTSAFKEASRDFITCSASTSNPVSYIAEDLGIWARK